MAVKWIFRTVVGVAILAVTGFAGVSAAQAQAAAPSACHFQIVAEIPLRFEHNQPLMQATINGKKAWLLADTGAFISLISTDGASYLGLPTRNADGVVIGGVGGATNARKTVIHQLQMGGYTQADIPFFVAGAGLGSFTDAGEKTSVVGVFGRDFFGQVDFEFDLAASKLRLFKPLNCAKTWLGYWSNAVIAAPIDRSGDANDAFRIPVKLNGRSVDAILDSGAQVSVVTPSAAQRAGAELTAAPGGELANRSHGLGPRSVDTQIGKFDSVSIGDEQVKNTHLRVTRLFEDFEDDIHAGSRALSSNGDPDMLLGADFLRSHRVLVSASQNKLYYSYSGGPVFQVVGKAADPAKTTSSDAAPEPGQTVPK